MTTARTASAALLALVVLIAVAVWHQKSVTSGELASDTKQNRPPAVFLAWSSGAIKDAGRRRRASATLRNGYGALAANCVKLLEDNAGIEPAKMKPDYVAVREAIEQLGMLSGFCQKTGQSAKIAELMVKFVAVDLVFVSTDGLPPLGPGRKPDQLTVAARNLPLLGMQGAEAALADIAAGGLKGDLKPRVKHALYKPHVYSRILENIFGGSDMTRKYLEQAIRGERKEKPKARLTSFLKYYNQLYPGYKPEPAGDR